MFLNSQNLFWWVGSSYQVAKVLELQLQHQSFQLIFGVDSFQDWLVWSLCSPRDSQESSQMSQFKNINFCSAFFIFQLSHLYMTIGKTMALTQWTFIGKVMSLLFNMLSRFVIVFLRSKCLNFMAAVTICSDFESEVTQSCLILCYPMGCSLPGFSIHRIL